MRVTILGRPQCRDSRVNWSDSRESNPDLNLGKVSYCQYTRVAKLERGTRVALVRLGWRPSMLLLNISRALVTEARFELAEVGL